MFFWCGWVAESRLMICRGSILSVFRIGCLTLWVGVSWPLVGDIGKFLKLWYVVSVARWPVGVKMPLAESGHPD